jgi:hypothetical protein
VQPPAARRAHPCRSPLGRASSPESGHLVASSTAANTATSIAWSIFRFGWGFSTNQVFNGDIALIACFAASWTPAMVRRWHADPFGFLRPWNELPALMGNPPPATPPSTGTGVVVCLMG